IQLDWTAYSEENLGRYTIERSADGITFTSIGYVNALNTVTETNYGFFDPNPLQGISYYRLKNIDLDGKFGYSTIVRVNLDKNSKDIRVYPNPATGGFVSIQTANLAKGNYTVKLFNAGGQQVYSQRFTHTGGSINQTIQLPTGTRSGMYNMQLDNDAVKVMSRTFMVQ
ncbi:MAG: T9SS type A sorting domain-containing protein, partial [Chitinophagaceae bacterium]